MKMFSRDHKNINIIGWENFNFWGEKVGKLLRILSGLKSGKPVQVEHVE